MNTTIQCDIVSAHEEIFSGEVTLFIAPGTAGELGIAPRHAPLITTLKPGPLRLQLPDGEESVYIISGGILEVMPHLVTVLADTAVRAQDVDRAAAEQARKDAERDLVNCKSQMEIAEVEVKLAVALAELRAIELLQKAGRRSPGSRADRR